MFLWYSDISNFHMLWLLSTARVSYKLLTTNLHQTIQTIPLRLGLRQCFSNIRSKGGHQWAHWKKNSAGHRFNFFIAIIRKIFLRLMVIESDDFRHVSAEWWCHKQIQCFLWINNYISSGSPILLQSWGWKRFMFPSGGLKDNNSINHWFRVWLLAFKVKFCAIGK